ncbi:MAG TPA: hypothetical protein EYO90_04725, partial [Candidatus Latescibacteria bacterium]|nr:hypothetical protein [Candidatus Latescibacterota bacterium]
APRQRSNAGADTGGGRQPRISSPWFGVSSYHCVSNEGRSREAHEAAERRCGDSPPSTWSRQDMRVLSSDFVSHFPNRIVNIHHPFLPAFAGALPYEQAFARGVIIIRHHRSLCRRESGRRCRSGRRVPHPGMRLQRGFRPVSSCSRGRSTPLPVLFPDSSRVRSRWRLNESSVKQEPDWGNPEPKGPLTKPIRAAISLVVCFILPEKATTPQIRTAAHCFPSPTT